MSQELEARNTAMYKMHAQGKTLQYIADQFGISRQAVAKIIARYGAMGISDDESRTLQRAQLEYLQSEMIAIVSNGPAPAVNVKGEIIYDEFGEMVKDYSGVISAADTARKISAETRRMDALDLPRRKQMIEDEAMKEANRFLAQLDSKIIQAEVIKEIPPEE
jgi:hypothetical protein